jgi:hypothetical protein
VPRRARTGETTQVQALPGDLATRYDDGAPPVAPPPSAASPVGPVSVYTTRGRRLRWRLALVTGLLGFAVCIVAYTVPELIAGGAVGGDGRGTTLWGGKERRSTPGQKAPASTATTPQTTTTGAATQARETATVTQTVTTPAPAASTGAPSAAVPATPQPEAPAPAATAPSDAPGATVPDPGAPAGP